MTLWYIATLARSVIIEAEDEATARNIGRAALADLELDAGLRARLGRDVPIDIRTVRPATPDEIELCNWQKEANR